VLVDSIAELTARVRAFAQERDWEQFHTPKNLAMALAGEVGELLAELQWLTPEQSAAVMADKDLGPRVRAEIEYQLPLSVVVVGCLNAETSAGQPSAGTDMTLGVSGRGS
jgi:hypothetical protein